MVVKPGRLFLIAMLSLVVMSGFLSNARADINCGVDQVQDAYGNLYNTVQIGSQCWMAENLNAGRMVDSWVDQSNNTIIEKYCYNDDLDYCATDGGLYQWDEMMMYSATDGAQGICPKGWHIPTDTEWKTMEITLGMSQTQADGTNWRGVDQGNQLKAGGASGFEARLSGFHFPNSSFYYYNQSTVFWTATTTNEIGYVSWNRCLSFNEPRVSRTGYYSWEMGLSVRCVKD
jgi:uncharacterized protein (TIGR02145 family)